MRFQKGRLLYIILFLSLFVFSVISILVVPVWGDEKIYHLPNARNCDLQSVLRLSSGYSSAYTPLPYFIGSIALQVYPDCVSLRVVNLMVCILTALIVFRISACISNEPMLLTFLIICNPYIIRSSYIYYMNNYGLMFSLVGVYFYYFSQIKFRIILAFGFFLLAVLSQQWMLCIPIAIALAEVHTIAKKEDFVLYLRRMLLLLVIMSPAIVLFLHWGGLTHPNFSQHTLHATLEHANGTLACFGFLLVFFSLSRFKQYLRLEYLYLTLLLPFFYFSIPEFSTHQGEGVFTGLEAQSSRLLETVTHLPYSISMMVLIVAGAIILAEIVQLSKTQFQLFMKYAILTMFVSFSMSTMLGSHHVYVVLPFLIIALHERIFANRFVLYTTVSLAFVVTLIYNIYFAFFKVYY